MEYIKEDLEQMLRDHPKNEAKLTEIKLKQVEYEELLKFAGTVYEDTEKEIIENMQLGGNSYDNIHSNTNKVTDKVSETAMNYHKEQIHVNKYDKEELKRKIEECKRQDEILDRKIVRVKNLLMQLSDEEEFVIRIFYMRNSKWDYVEKRYFNEFEKHKSIKQLQVYRDSAIESMLDIINTGI